LNLNSSVSGLDLPAIATFCAFGFFLDDDTYFLNQKFKVDTQSDWGKRLEKFKNFNWYYEPSVSSLKDATEKFTELFESTVYDQTKNRKVILPLSGGLDSRTLASAHYRKNSNVNAFSYHYPGGIKESAYAEQIAEWCHFPIQTWKIEPGYLWNCIDELATINKCLTDFIHPRQMAFSGRFKDMGEIFSLGHWGDVLFDNAGLEKHLSRDKFLDILLKKITRTGGNEIASDLWKAWNLPGNWMEYIRTRVGGLVEKLDIRSDANARLRAFKSRYWAVRWTAASFAIYEKSHPVSAPYFDTGICDLICTVDESVLAQRKIQIEYLKKYAPGLAAIEWQAHRPFNLYSYHKNKTPYNLPFRMMNKLNRILNSTGGQRYVQRNWEIQFKGRENDENLKSIIFSEDTDAFIPPDLRKKYYSLFRDKDSRMYAHPLSMLLTLLMFSKLRVSA
jgi:hypothetical protein